MNTFASPVFRSALHNAAPRMSRRFFSCQAAAGVTNCIRLSPKSSLIGTLRQPHSKPRSHLYSHIRILRIIASKDIRSFASFARLNQVNPTASLTSELSPATPKARPFFPDTSSNTVAYFLLFSAVSVFGIVVFGGLTRLTESGLSITEWRPVTGSLPPMSDADWATEFDKYRASPEFHLLNSRMTLDEFKNIYWMEWIHRLWGRAVGLGFVLPSIYFIAKRQVSKPMMLRLSGIAGLIGFQGFIGWWMVKSGLKDDLFAPGSHPRVSQYRLAAHLGTAFVCYMAMLWNGLNILRTNRLLSMGTDQAAGQLFSLRNPALKPFKISVALLTGLVFTTAISGALVAGLDAGMIYNEFPYMGVGLTPPKSELWDPFYARDTERHSDLWWRNMLENPSLVQLNHRILATTTFASVLALFAYSRMSRQMKAFLPAAAKRGIHGVLGFACLQVVLGITTLMFIVPIHLASAHQAGALALLTWTTILGSRIWFPTAAARLLQKRMQGVLDGTLRQQQLSAVAKMQPREGALAQVSASAFCVGASSLAVAYSLDQQKTAICTLDQGPRHAPGSLVVHGNNRKEQVFDTTLKR